jgi:hypothetical protein
MGPPKKGRQDVERRLFDLSIGPLRLLDTILDKAREHRAAALLRELLIDWRAYPSKSRFSAKDLQIFLVKLGKIEAALRRANEDRSARLVSEIGHEVERWAQS